MKTVAFFFVDFGNEQFKRMATVMVESVRAAIPDAHIMQMGARARDKIPGVDQMAIGHPGNDFEFATFRSRLMAAINAPEVLFLDADILVLRDPWEVFAGDFDICLTNRNGARFTYNGVDETARMPWNCGVMFSKSQSFMRALHEEILLMPEHERKWVGEQVALGNLARAGKFNIFEVPGRLFNRAPAKPGDDLEGVYIAHYKGDKRKDWMLADAKKLPLKVAA